jgi:hypothetical protein
MKRPTKANVLGFLFGVALETSVLFVARIFGAI